MRLLWAADRRSVVLGVALQLTAGLGFGVQLLVANRIARVLLASGHGDGHETALLGFIVLAGAVVAAVTFASMALGGVNKILGERVVRHVQRLILDTTAQTDVLRFEDPVFYDRLQRAQQQGVPTPLMISGAILQACASVAVVIGVALALIVISPVLLPLVLLGAFPAAVAAARSSQDLFGFSYGNTANDRARAALSDVVTTRRNVEEARLYGLGAHVRRRWEALYDSRIADAAILVRNQRRRSAVAATVYALVAALTFGLLAVLVARGAATVAAAATAAIAAQQLGTQLLALAGSAAVIYENVLYLDDFDNFTTAITGSGPTGPPAPDTIGRIEVDDVHLRYPGATRDAVDGISLTISEGEIVALVGENGSGKTTLAKILAGLYPPTHGAVRWDGTNITTYDTGTVHQRLGVVFQDFVRYPFTLAENIGVGDTTRLDDIDAIQRAINDAGARELTDALPAGIDTVLGKQFEGGTDLSVGQWQRIALARAFFRAAPILILDEPTSAMDPRAEQALFDTIRRLCSGRTVIVISHRFSSVRSADRIIVLDHGRVREQGTHEQLMASNDLYAELFALQAAAYNDETVP